MIGLSTQQIQYILHVFASYARKHKRGVWWTTSKVEPFTQSKTRVTLPPPWSNRQKRRPEVASVHSVQNGRRSAVQCHNNSPRDG